jgi:hypothetical protein
MQLVFYIGRESNTPTLNFKHQALPFFFQTDICHQHRVIAQVFIYHIKLVNVESGIG